MYFDHRRAFHMCEECKWTNTYHPLPPLLPHATSPLSGALVSVATSVRLNGLWPIWMGVGWTWDVHFCVLMAAKSGKCIFIEKNVNVSPRPTGDCCFVVYYWNVSMKCLSRCGSYGAYVLMCECVCAARFYCWCILCTWTRNLQRI